MLLLIGASTAFGQADIQSLKNRTYSDVNADLFKDYSLRIGRGAAVFNGAEYRGKDPGIAGHQFYKFKNPQYGSVQFNGFRYDSLLIAYDIAEDQLVQVYQDRGSYFLILMDLERVSGFHLDGHEFINVRQDDKAPGGSGFFDLIYDGPTMVLAKRRKTVIPSTISGYLYEFKESDRYFVKSGDSYRPITSGNGLYKIFRERKKEIKNFVRSRRLTFRDRPDEYLREVCTYLDRGEG